MKYTLFAVLLCLGAVAMSPPSPAEYTIFLPLVAKAGYNTSNFHLSDTCDGPARAWFPAGTSCIAAIFDYRDLGAIPIELHLSKNGEELAAYWFLPNAPWGTGTFCGMLCDGLNSGTYTITCSITEWTVGEQTFQVGQ